MADRTFEIFLCSFLPLLGAVVLLHARHGHRVDEALGVPIVVDSLSLPPVDVIDHVTTAAIVLALPPVAEAETTAPSEPIEHTDDRTRRSRLSSDPTDRDIFEPRHGVVHLI